MQDKDIIYDKESMQVYMLVKDQQGQLKKRDKMGGMSDFDPSKFEKYSDQAPIMAKFNYQEGLIESLSEAVGNVYKMLGIRQ